MSDNKNKNIGDSKVMRFFTDVVGKAKCTFTKANVKKLGGKVCTFGVSVWGKAKNVAKNVWSWIKKYSLIAWQGIKKFALLVKTHVVRIFMIAKAWVVGICAKLFKSKKEEKPANAHDKSSAQSKHSKEKEQNAFVTALIGIFGAIALFFSKNYKKFVTFLKNKKAQRAVAKELKAQNLKSVETASKPKPAPKVAAVKPTEEVAHTQEAEKTRMSVRPVVPTKVDNKTQADGLISDFGMPIPDMDRLAKREKQVAQTEKEEDTADDEGGIWVFDKKPFFLTTIAVTVCKISIVLVLLAGFACLGIGLGIVRAYIASAPELKVDKIENNDRTSYIYDANGDLVTEYYNLENRAWVSYDEIPTMLKYAVVASEDETFFEHDGFNFKRIVAAALSQVGGGSTSGGSTITQQVLKLTLLTSQQTYKRKIQEIYLAYQLEKEYDKEEILEWYMNIMPMGGLLYGVKTAAEDYFGKELNQLNLRECAVLAGMTNAPTMYNPRLCMLATDDGGFGDKGRERLYKRANYVLTQMYAVGFISEQEYNESLFDITDLVSEQLVVEKTSKDYTYEHKYYVEYVLDELVDRLMTVFGWEGELGREQAHSYIRTGGLHIYTALDDEKQTMVENAVYSFKDWPALADPKYSVSAGGVEQPQCAAVVIDNKTGFLTAIVGGRTEPTIRLGLNRAYQSLLPLGSCIKPLSVYAPALDQGKLSNMVEVNAPVPIKGWISPTGFPKNFDGVVTCYGPTSISYSLARSFNIPTARIILGRIGLATSASYLRAMNFSETAISDSPSDMSLGSKGAQLINSVAAFATFANGGMYRNPISITRIVDKDGEDIFTEDKQEARRVFKTATAYIITNWLHRATQKPDAPINIELKNTGIEISGKTGTNEGGRGIGYMGYSKYYTCGIWMGHDDFTPGFASNVTAMYFATPLWLDIMNALHENLPNSKIYPTTDSDVIEVTVCGVTGLLPNGDVCKHDQGGYGTKKELFIRGTEPTQICDKHIEVTYCTDSGLLANSYCTEDCKEIRTALILDKNSEYFKLLDSDDYEYLLYKYFPIYYIDNVPYIGVLETDKKGNIKVKEVLKGNKCYCKIHNENTTVIDTVRKQMKKDAEAYIKQLNKTLALAKYKNNLSVIEKEQIAIAIELLEEKVNAPLYSADPKVETFSEEKATLAFDALKSLSEELLGAVDEKLDVKSDYSIIASSIIPKISEKLNSIKYSAVILAEEKLLINEMIDAFNTALNAPIASEDPEAQVFDSEILQPMLDELQLKADELFAILDERIADLEDEVDENLLVLKKDPSSKEIIDTLNSLRGIVVNAANGHVKAFKAMDAKIAPAELTNIMVAIVAYEYVVDNGIDMDTTFITCTQGIVDAVAGMYNAGYVDGENVSLTDVFHGVLFSSAADATLMLANYCGGSEDAFVAMMNNRAYSMKLKSTQFANCTGKNNSEHYTSVADVAVMIDYAYKYGFLKSIMEKQTYTYSATNMSAPKSAMSMLTNFRTTYDFDITKSAIPGAVGFGGVTGQSGSAGCCIATVAYGSDGVRYIVVLAGSSTKGTVIGDMLYAYSGYAGFVAPDNTDPDNTDPDNTDPDNTDPDNTDPDNTDPDNTDPDVNTEDEGNEDNPDNDL